MPLDQLQAYEQYTQQHGLPLWRLEMQLARIAQILDAIRVPGLDRSVADYLIRPPQTDHHHQTTTDQTPPTEADADAAAAALDFKPRQRRKPTPP